MKVRPNPLRTVDLELLEQATGGGGGVDDHMEEQGYRRNRWQGNVREYCMPRGRWKSCTYGVAENGTWRAPATNDDYKRVEHLPIYRASGGTSPSWGELP